MRREERNWKCDNEQIKKSSLHSHTRAIHFIFTQNYDMIVDTNEQDTRFAPQSQFL